MPRPIEELEAYLNGAIRGQSHALRGIASAVTRAEVGLSKADRPQAVFLLLGPTGTGKTETCLNLANFLHGTRDVLVRFDMGEYGHEDSLKRLIGENKSDPGLLGAAIDANPQGGILLLDEIEKAHPKISKVFLGATDAARTTSTDGVTRRLDNWYIIFTSNLGSASAAQMTGVPYKMVERTVIAAATNYFSPETMARFTNKIVFQSLSYETQRMVAQDLAAKEARHFENVAGRKGLDVSCGVTASAIGYLIRNGYTQQMGARPMRDAIERLMGEPFAKWLLNREPKSCIKRYFLEFDAMEAATEISMNVRSLESAQEAGESARPTSTRREVCAAS
jgi:ATP-dependent Clp protease ATP-binding subunit ClpB